MSNQSTGINHYHERKQARSNITNTIAMLESRINLADAQYTTSADYHVRELVLARKRSLELQLSQAYRRLTGNM